MHVFKHFIVIDVYEVFTCAFAGVLCHTQSPVNCRLAGAAPSWNSQLIRPTTICMATQEKAEILFSPFQEVFARNYQSLTAPLPYCKILSLALEV